MRVYTLFLVLFVCLGGCAYNHQVENTVTPVYDLAGEHVGDLIDATDNASFRLLY